jgi:asparagine synthase (glutamine-hydrolysing)
MCGVAGFVNLDGAPGDERVVRQMTAAVAHRGPDGEGIFVDGPVALGHRRLAILDLSQAGAQPMENEEGDIQLVFNGEIYNFRELRAELEEAGHSFRSRTDCEVVIHAYEEWGDAAIERFNGMFAFAVWDARRRRLLLTRDRYGIKPLYYARIGSVFAFGSEIKALLRHPAVSARISLEALNEYFAFQNIFTDLTLFEGVRLLPPATTLSFTLGSPDPAVHRYWDYRFDTASFKLSESDAADCLYGLFERAVSRQLVADVPIGSYLSGGMDSGSLVAVASRQIPRIRTFTGGFDLSSASGLELGFDERPASERLANHFKTEHYEMVLHAGDMEHVLPELTWHLEDLRVGQCYPNYYVARLASRFVRVVLSGVGGDELFAGYPWRYYRGLENGSGHGFFDAYYDYWQRLIPDRDRSQFFASPVYAAVCHAQPRDVFRSVFNGAPPPRDVEDVVNYSLYFEARTFLHGLFVVEDKLSMAHGLETRVPFLDNDLVDFALRVPPRYKLRDLLHAPEVDEDEAGKRTRYFSEARADGKQLLRQAMKRLVPTETIHGRKQGFSAPDASWFAGESIDYVNARLGDPGARIYDFVNPRYVRGMLDEHTSGRVNHRLLIWSLISFEQWCRTFLG